MKGLRILSMCINLMALFVVFFMPLRACIFVLVNSSDIPALSGPLFSVFYSLSTLHIHQWPSIIVSFYLSDFLCLIWHVAELDSLDVVFVGKDNDPTSVGSFHQSFDDFFKLPWSGLSGNLYGLCNTQPSCVTK